ncbi:hypothetical protein [Hydrogenophaga sp.]|uniref:hypothetical protein n=1 Tax=Hydrogenophaga sp. TaxID=1904254 RepID=UPI003F71BE46
MEKIKIENFLKDHCGNKFPEYESLSKVACSTLAQSICEKLSLPNSTDGLTLVKTIDSMARPCEAKANASENFDLNALLDSCGIDAEDAVYINWYRYDQIDRLKRNDVSNNFYDIWYPNVDSIDIFDDSLSWILLVRHDGYIKLLR